MKRIGLLLALGVVLLAGLGLGCNNKNEAAQRAAEATVRARRTAQAQAANATPTQPATLSYYNSEYRFSIAYPPNWRKLDAVSDSAGVTFANPEETAWFGIATRPAETRTAQDWMTNEEKESSRLPGYRAGQIDRQAVYKGLSGSQLQYEFRGKQDVPVTFREVYFVRDGVVFKIFIGSATALWPRLRPTPDELLAGILFH